MSYEQRNDELSGFEALLVKSTDPARPMSKEIIRTADGSPGWTSLDAKYAYLRVKCEHMSLDNYTWEKIRQVLEMTHQKCDDAEAMGVIIGVILGSMYHRPLAEMEERLDELWRIYWLGDDDGVFYG